ncbi:hypothetical protein [Paracoccus sp. (in: a-proteobacteria)]|uniref:hypothetical protein n=1 Tax=Paracoccus sp. TaxID=267 RepID=UPI00396C5620
MAIIAAALDERDRELRAQWRLDERTGFLVPTTGECELAIQMASLGGSQLMMLKAHAAAGDAGMSALQLAQAGGYADFSSANMHHGKGGRKLAEQMHAKLPESQVRAGEDVPTTAIATWLPTPGDPHNTGRWIMHPELREAVSRLP